MCTICLHWFTPSPYVCTYLGPPFCRFLFVLYVFRMLVFGAASLQLGQTSITQVAIEMDGIMQEEYLKASHLSTFCTRDMMKSVKCFSKSLECWANRLLCLYSLWGDSTYQHIVYLGSRKLTSKTITTTCKLHQWCYHFWSSRFVLPPHGVHPLERDTVPCLSTAQPWGIHQSASLA